MNSIKIEKGAVEAIKRVIRLHKKMDESINEADKNPSWDGHIFLYTDDDLKIEHMLCKIPIQVKGKNDESLFNKGKITYPVKYKYLRNYSVDGGVIYFVVIISDDGEKAAIFYNDLTSNKLQALLKGTKDKSPNQTKNIFLEKLENNDKNVLYNILFQFTYNNKKSEVVNKKYSTSGSTGRKKKIRNEIPKIHILNIADKAVRLTDVVTDYCLKGCKKENIISLSNLGIEYIPSTCEIAKFLGIRVIYKQILEEKFSFLNRKSLTIIISDKFIENSYGSRILVARELGHLFLDDDQTMAMGDDNRRYGYSTEVMIEYDANVFAILLMPQIMAGYSWEKLDPEDLNFVIYNIIVNSI